MEREGDTCMIHVRYAPKKIPFLFSCTVDRFRKTEIKRLLDGP